MKIGIGLSIYTLTREKYLRKQFSRILFLNVFASLIFSSHINTSIVDGMNMLIVRIFSNMKRESIQDCGTNAEQKLV